MGRAHRDGGRRCPGSRSVHDQYRHGGRHRNGDTGERVGTGWLRDGSHYREHARGCAGRARDSQPTGPHGHRCPPGRRLPLQRTPFADRVPGLRPSLVQIPYQPRQCGQRRQTRSPVCANDRSCHAMGQASAHRRELGQPGPGVAGAPDGRKRATQITLAITAGDVRSLDHLCD